MHLNLMKSLTIDPKYIDNMESIHSNKLAFHPFKVNHMTLVLMGLGHHGFLRELETLNMVKGLDLDS